MSGFFLRWYAHSNVNAELTPNSILFNLLTVLYNSYQYKENPGTEKATQSSHEINNTNAMRSKSSNQMFVHIGWVSKFINISSLKIPVLHT